MKHEVAQPEREEVLPVDVTRWVMHEPFECAACREGVVLGGCTRAVQRHRIPVESERQCMRERVVGTLPGEQAHREAVSAEDVVDEIPDRPAFAN